MWKMPFLVGKFQGSPQTLSVPWAGDTSLASTLSARPVASLCSQWGPEALCTLLNERMGEWMDGWMDGWLNGWMDEWMIDGWVHGWTDGWMDEWIDGWVDGWMSGWMPCGKVNVIALRQLLRISLRTQNWFLSYQWKVTASFWSDRHCYGASLLQILWGW